MLTGTGDTSCVGLVIENGTVDELRKADGAFAAMLRATRPGPGCL